MASVHRVERGPSETSQGADVRPLSAISSNRSFASSTSTLDSYPADNAPPLPSLVRVWECLLSKRSQSSAGPGWGFVLRGTTSEFAEGTRIYTCHVESVTSNGAASVAGLKESDQILSIDGLQVKHLEHADVVKMFQTRQKVVLVVLPVLFRLCYHARITRHNWITLNYLWALMHNLQSLDIININLDDRQEGLHEVNFSGLIKLKSLSINHCFLSSLNIKGLGWLQNLESLSLAHNYLTDEVFDGNCPIHQLTQLKKLDLSRNLLNKVPESLTKLKSLEVLVLVDNNISELPPFLSQLTLLHTLCLDGNLLRDIDQVAAVLPTIQKLTLSNNALECETQSLKICELLITSVEGNPFTKPDETGVVTRKEPSLRRTLSVRGTVVAPRKENRKSVEWDPRNLEYVATQ